MATAGRRTPGKTSTVATPEPADARLLEEADLLDVPWREIVAREIALARARRRYRDAEAGGDVLWKTLTGLPNALLPPPVGDRKRRRASDPFSDADWIAYLRVLELEHLARAAERLPGEQRGGGWRLRSQTGCDPEDARWAIARAAAPARERGRPLDDAVARVRAEGLELPPAKSGVESVRRLQREVRKRLGISRRRRTPSGG